MESSRPRPPGVVDTATVPELAGLLGASGPFVTVYLNTEPAVENAAQRNELRWNDLRQQLEEQGAPPAALEAIDPLVPAAHTEGRTLVVVAGAGGLLLARHEPEPVAADLGRVAALPSLGPLLEWTQAAVPHVIVLADRVGADLVGVGGGGEDVLASVGPSNGHDPRIRKSKPGGWSQRRYQDRAEVAWEERAGEVAERVAAMVDDLDARLVVVAGDVRAVQLLREELPAEVAALVQEVDGSRAVDGGVDQLAEDVVRLTATVAAADTTECLRRWKEETGREAAGVEGTGPVMAALRESRVDVLLVHDDPADQRAGWFLREAGMPAEGPAVLGELNVGEEPESARLVDVAIFAALRTGAGVRIVPSVPQDGLGALLRY
ncbi:MAG: hypothetical protein M3357_13210 [Actinomycetota bacterium]|nr:hypothetical protein [Actinomycetota bacterium]